MSSQGGACEAARLLVSASQPRRGGHRNYLPWHVLEALRLLKRSPMGRPQLSRSLGLGEASTKTLLSELEKLGLAARTGRGRTLTPLGGKILETLGSAIIIRRSPAKIFGEEETITIQVPGIEPPGDLTRVYMIRDYLVEYGCRTALIGGTRGGSSFFPGTPPEIAGAIAPPARCDGLLIVVPKHCEKEAVSAALAILADTCSH